METTTKMRKLTIEEIDKLFNSITMSLLILYGELKKRTDEQGKD
jgi:hypothetical protein